MKFLSKLKKKLKERKSKLLEKKVHKQTKHYILDKYLAKAGFKIHSYLLSRGLFRLGIAVNIAITIGLIMFFVTNEGYSITYILFVMLIVWLLAFFVVLAVMWLLFYLFLDLRVFKRKLDIEEVLPDFLYLTATNIRSGMTVDNALWFAVRPRFGVLAKEIETVAKEVMSGIDLTQSLERFSDKYESDILKRSISLLIEGISSGGEIGELLTRIASNIQESRLLRKEMAANVTTYVIFISFAAIIAAPVLLALSNQLLLIIGDVISTMDVPAAGTSMFTITSIAVTPEDFRIFAFSSLAITSFFSAIIIATIRKGSIKEGIKYIPIFMLVSVIIYILASYMIGNIMGSVIV